MELAANAKKILALCQDAGKDGGWDTFMVESRQTLTNDIDKREDDNVVAS